MKKIIGFDLDDTLAITKSPISDRMAGILNQLISFISLSKKPSPFATKSMAWDRV